MGLGLWFIGRHLNVSLGLAEERYVKGRYKKVKAGEIKNFTGIDIPCEPLLSLKIHLDSR